MGKRTYKEAVDISINWWIEKSFKTAINQNNGDTSSNGIFTFGFVNMFSSKAQQLVTEEKIEKFRSKLTELLLEQEGKYVGFNELYVDYSPNPILSEACEFAEINPNCLPCKTFTMINLSNEIEGCYQYGGERFII